ncbi:GGDEF domain-containing protein [Mycobacterium sp. ITM-2016-00317]|uniref:GGDEF domain-containing protein n=1 Tax=Mycobacterium sp. ITM-2016-00317 TaxID=2099694 RepID=UPI00287F6C60|nr:GGDEF domain-containing protein [Mycobacterium sp. ITM-2016-00317]WNG88322.1 GGDEF domain-containing protein [Mycobacterium sp. ITM-2016-00317]
MGDRAVDNPLLQWWRQRDDYQWRVEFLRSRGLLSVLRWLIAGIGATMGALSVLNVFLTPGVDGTPARVGWAVVAIGSLGWAARWAFLPWPTPRASAAMVVFVDVLMTLSALLFGDPALAMSGIPILLCAGGYVVFFHGPRLHLAHIMWCTVSVVGIAVWLAATTPEHGLQVALSRAVIALLVTVCILPALQFGFWLLQDSSMQSLTDPLTELTNRRGLAVSVKRLNEGVPPDADLCALLIDIDGFKTVNDTLGHATGDDVLIRTARRIRASVPERAVVVRWGGEEFLVVDRMPGASAEGVAERIRGEVSAPAQPPVTVSIGLACARSDADLGDVITAADTAMYEAKARGGDRVVVTTEAH